MTVTPVTNRPSVCRNARVSKGRSAESDTASLGELFHHDADVGRIDEVGHGPTVEIVFSHAGFSETLVARGCARHLRCHEDFVPDAFVIAEIVPLVELVPAAELRADGVPEEFDELHALFRRVAAGPAHELIEIRPQLRHLE